MARFKKFADGKDSHSVRDSAETGFRRVNKGVLADPEGMTRLEKIWAQDFDKCKTKEDLQHYIDVNARNTSNPYVKKAKEQLEEIDRRELAKFEAERENRRRHLQEQPNISTQNENAHPYHKTNYGWGPIGVVVTVFVVALIVYVSYDGYQQRHEKPDNLKNSNDTVLIVVKDSSTKITQPPIEPPIPHPVQVWVPCWDCNGSGECVYCHGRGWNFVTNSSGEILTTQECNICFGNGRCQVCMGARGHYETRMEY